MLDGVKFFGTAALTMLVTSLILHAQNGGSKTELLSWAIFAAALIVACIFGSLAVKQARDPGSTKKLRVRSPIQWPVELTPKDSDAKLPAPYVEFQSQIHIADRITHVNLHGLWVDLSPYIDIEIQLRNTSPYPVTITGVDGHLYCANLECQYPARLETMPYVLPPMGTQTMIIRQPVTSEMQQAFTWQVHALSLRLKENVVAFSLGRVKLLGTVDMGSGSSEMPARVVSQEVFKLRGPVWESDVDKVFWPIERIFVSQEHWALDGQWRHGGGSDG